MKTRLINVVGARPSVITIAAIVEEMMKYPELEALLVHTGRHHDEAMCESFVVDLNLPNGVFTLAWDLVVTGRRRAGS